MTTGNTGSILLVDEDDNILGTAEKLEVHQKGLLHRAFSVFIFNDEGDILMQKRSGMKYHSPNVWTNTCCSHQTSQTSEMQYIHGRLRQEMGFDTELAFLFKHRYRTQFDNGLTEHEIDHVYYGIYNGDPIPNPEEVAAWRWSDCDMVLRDISAKPDEYSYWFRELYPLVFNTDRIQFILG
ncbi:MAG: isopentenyl-diphosphate Delta-isomerase [Spirochaetota bacterium]